MKLITNKSKNLLYRISSDSNTTVQFSTSYSVVTQTTADTAGLLSFKLQGYNIKTQRYTNMFSGEVISSTGVFTKTFTTPSTTEFDLIRFGLDGVKYDTCANCKIDLKPNTTYTFTCNFTNITQGSISWKDMMLVEGSTAGDYEPFSYNLLDKWQFEVSHTSNGVTWTNNGDGSIMVNGYATGFTGQTILRNSPVNYTHKYLFNPNYASDLRNTMYELVFIGNNTTIHTIEEATNPIIVNISNYTNILSCRINLKRAYDSTSGYYTYGYAEPVFYDLTLMYGAGNEPTTVDQFYADHPELKVAPLGFIGLKNLEISNKNIKRLRYKTWNNSLNLIDKSKFNPSREVVGVTFTNNGDGSWAVNGTATSHIYSAILKPSTLQLNTSHKYLLSGCPKEGSNSLFLYVDNGGALFGYDTGSGSIGIPTKTTATITISVSPNIVVDNAIFKPQLYDLTEIYGAGKEPTTVEQFYTDHPLAKTSPLGFSDLGIIPSNSGYILNKYDNLSEELLEENIEKDTVNYHIPNKTNILLNKVEGKTNKIVQLADKGNYRPTVTRDGVIFTNNGDGTFIINGKSTASDYSNYYFLKNYELTNDWLRRHKYLFYFSDRTDLNYYAVVGGSTSKLEYSELGYTLSGTRTPMWKILSPTDNSIGGNSYFILRVKSGVVCTNELASPQVFDLTSMYGFGNEPTTVEQFKKDYPQFFDEKLDGIWSVKTTGVSTTGKNLFDIDSVSFFTKDSNGEYKSNKGINIRDILWTPTDGTKQVTISGYIKCPVDKNYRFMITYTDGTFLDKTLYSTGNYNYQAITSDSSKTVSFIRLAYSTGSDEVYIKDVQIEERPTATDYVPYTENKIDLLSTQELNGINGVNDYIEVIDKGNGLYDLKKTKNIDSVDLGTLDWAVDGAIFSSGSISSVIKLPADDNSVGNYTCQKYVNVALAKSFVDGDFGVNSSGYLYFRNSAYTTAAAFKTAMNGVILYYQLKTPVITTIATNLTYNQVSAIRTNGGLLLVNDNNNQKYAQPNVTVKGNYQYKN